MFLLAKHGGRKFRKSSSIAFQTGCDLELVVDAACGLTKSTNHGRYESPCVFLLLATLRVEEVSKGRCVLSLPTGILFCRHLIAVV